MKYIPQFFLLMFFWSLATCHSRAFGQGLQIHRLSGDFYVFTTYHMLGESLFPANGLYAVTQKGVVMIDTPWDTTQFQSLLDSIRARHRLPVVHCIATHSHDDRTAGLPYYQAQGIATWTSRKTDSISSQNGGKRARFLLPTDTTMQLGSLRFRVFYPGPGHTADNMVVWFPDAKVLYGGCLIKSTEAIDLGYTGEADLKQWPATMANLQKEFGLPAWVVPGHQSWQSNGSIAHTIRLLREAQK